MGETISRDAAAALQKRAVAKNVNGEPILPTDDAFAAAEEP